MPQPSTLFMLPEEVALTLDIHVDELREMRLNGEGPAYFAIGSVVRYLLVDVTAWRNTHQSERAATSAA